MCAHERTQQEWYRPSFHQDCLFTVDGETLMDVLKGQRISPGADVLLSEINRERERSLKLCTKIVYHYETVAGEVKYLIYLNVAYKVYRSCAGDVSPLHSKAIEHVTFFGMVWLCSDLKHSSYDTEMTTRVCSHRCWV